MPEHERREIAAMIYKCYDVLHDLSNQHNVVVPPWLWTQLHRAVAELKEVADPDERIPSADADTTKPAIDEAVTAAWTRLRENSGTLNDVLAILTASDTQLGTFVTSQQRTLLIDLDDALRAHGFSGAQLRMKADTVDFAYNDYIAQGRVRDLPKFQESGVWHRVRGVGRRVLNVLSPGSVALQSLSAVPVIGSVLAGVGELCSFAVAAVEAGQSWRAVAPEPDS